MQHNSSINYGMKINDINGKKGQGAQIHIRPVYKSVESVKVQSHSNR